MVFKELYFYSDFLYLKIYNGDCTYMYIVYSNVHRMLYAACISASGVINDDDDGNNACTKVVTSEA